MQIYFISKAKKGHEYLYMREFTIKCKTKKEAEKLAAHLNENDKTSLGVWKLGEGQTWHAYEEADWAICPLWKLKRKNGNLIVTHNV